MFEAPVFEDQPLVPTNSDTGKFDIEAFLTLAKEQQRKWFISTSIFATVAISYALYLCAQYPLRLMAPNGTTGGIIGACKPATGPAWALSAVNVVLVLLPLVLWLDQLRSFLRPAPSNGPGVITFKPYYVRATSSDQIVSPQQYFQHIRDRSINWLQTIVLGISFTSCIGMFMTFAYKGGDLCTESPWSLSMPYLLGTVATIAFFIAVLVTMVYKHKKAMMSSFSPTAALDSYHPL